MDIDLSDQNKLLDAYRIDYDVDDDANESEDDGIRQIHAPGFVIFHEIHPDEEDGRSDQQLNGYEEGLVEHEHRGDEQESDEGDGGDVGLVLSDETGEKEEQGDGEINDELGNDGVFLQNEEENRGGHRIQERDQIEDPIHGHEAADNRGNKQNGKGKIHQQMKYAPYLEIRDIGILLYLTKLRPFDAAVAEIIANDPQSFYHSKPLIQLFRHIS